MQPLRLDDMDLTGYLSTDEKRRVVPAFVLGNMVRDHFQIDPVQQGIGLPWQSTRQHIRLRPHEVSVWAGINGHGKSMLLSQVMLSAMLQGKRVCIASFEMTMIQTMARMTRQAIGTDNPSDDYIMKFSDWTENRLWLYDQMGTVQPNILLAVIRYCRDQLNIDHFVVDSLMKCGIAKDDYNTQKWFVDRLCDIAKHSGVHIHLVAHSRKRDTEAKMMDKFDVEGASDITNMVDNVFTVWRHKKKEAERKKISPDPVIISMPDVFTVCDKQRHGEWEGMINLWFDIKSMQYRDHEHLTTTTWGQ